MAIIYLLPTTFQCDHHGCHNVASGMTACTDIESEVILKIGEPRIPPGWSYQFDILYCADCTKLLFPVKP